MKRQTANCEWQTADGKFGIRISNLRPAAIFSQLLILSLLALALTACANDDGTEAIEVSGFIEGDEILVAPEAGGRIAQVAVDEGDAVETGDELVRLDDALLQTQRSEALAAVAAAEANLSRVQAGPRPAEVNAARAAVDQATAQQQGAAQALENAQAALDNPQELNTQIAAAQTAVRLAEQNLELARANLSGVEGNAQWNSATDSLQVQAAQAVVEAAQARLDGARRYLNSLYAMRNTPLTQMALLHAAEAQARISDATVQAAQAALDEQEAGPTTEEVNLAAAQLHQAQAALALVDTHISQLILTAPISGVVSSRNAHAGETAAPGIALLTIANLDQVTLVVYIPENRIGQVQVGQPVEVTVDSFPGQVFEGQVTSIAGEAEFTPRNVQTREERVNLVFAVEIVIPNPGHALKPGMPADAIIRP